MLRLKVYSKTFQESRTRTLGACVLVLIGLVVARVSLADDRRPDSTVLVIMTTNVIRANRDVISLVEVENLEALTRFNDTNATRPDNPLGESGTVKKAVFTTTVPGGQR